MGMNNQSSDNERQPLLPPIDGHAKSPSRRTVWQWPIFAILAVKTFLVENPILICTFCLQFCTYFAKHMVEVPTIKLFEQAICNRYYSHQSTHLSLAIPDIDEGLCKVPAIQNELAALTGLKFTFDALPGLLTALYYGSIADRYGAHAHAQHCKLPAYWGSADLVDGPFLRYVAQALYAAIYGFYSFAMLIPACR